ncbi:hypothetical protein ppKF707_3111 [Metapseudomonas furukawaii]|uniref:Uncharacterized protein n=1 Tax=Metapseudomonas furukawaii TaxID=1149133 RepID=A0AAD1BZW3_METFU|nr:hypothetical protein ppKF707_3111 [Pseudomonas furukawaii]BAU74348.1 hypothetical protein KF707C_26600 [Pseudomonas furukawaii]
MLAPDRCLGSGRGILQNASIPAPRGAFKSRSRVNRRKALCHHGYSPF